MQNNMTFYTWLRTQRNRDDVVGDIARDIHDDPTVNADKVEHKSKNNLRSHIAFVSGYDKEVLEAFDLAWNEYKKFRHDPL